MKENLIPTSDLAGEIISVGKDVTNWKQGDRVCVNFSLNYAYGPTPADLMKTSLGGCIDGALAEYRTFPAHV